VKVGVPNDEVSDERMKQEILIFEYLKPNGLSCIPKCLGKGRLNDTIEYSIFQHTDFSIKEYFEANGIPGKLNHEQVIVQMIQAVQDLHDLGYIHGDIKPEIFRIKDNRVLIIDLEHATEHKDNGALKPQINCGFQKTDSYHASIKSLQGYSPSRSDDLESIGYAILSIL
jgi:serine/threonine protein kinase